MRVSFKTKLQEVLERRFPSIYLSVMSTRNGVQVIVPVKMCANGGLIAQMGKRQNLCKNVLLQWCINLQSRHFRTPSQEKATCGVLLGTTGKFVLHECPKVPREGLKRMLDKKISSPRFAKQRRNRRLNAVETTGVSSVCVLCVCVCTIDLRGLMRQVRIAGKYQQSTLGWKMQC